MIEKGVKAALILIVVTVIGTVIANLLTDYLRGNDRPDETQNGPSIEAPTEDSPTSVPSIFQPSAAPKTVRPSSKPVEPSTQQSSLPPSPIATPSPTVLRSRVQYLADLKRLPDSRARAVDSGVAEMGGESYARSVVIDPYGDEPAYVEYYIGDDYRQLAGVVGLRFDVPSDTSMKIEIYGDSSLLFDVTISPGEVVPIPPISTEDIERLRLQVTDLTPRYPLGVYSVFGDIRLIL